MSIRNLEFIVRDLVTKLARGDYDLVIATCSTSRLSADELRGVISDYGRTFIAPPADAYKHLDVVEVRGTDKPTWSVWAPLWSEEEGRSDLEMQLTILQQGDNWNVELDSLHVP